MRFGILGPLEVTDDGGRELALGGLKQRSVLAILLLHPNEVLSRDRLIEDLWSGRPPASAAATLHAHVSRLRRALGGEQRIVTAPGGYLIRVGPGELDRDLFERLIEEGAGAIAEAAWEPASTKLQEALALWRGPPLGDLQYESFAQAEIARLSELHVGALEQRIEAELGLGRGPRVIGDLEGLVRQHPHRERLRAQLMLALYRAGRQAEALEAYRDARAALVDELGIEPSAELRDLHQAILAQDRSLLGAAAQSQPAFADAGSPPVEEPAPREERKVVTIVCATLAPGTDHVDPEDLRALLAPYQARVRTELQRFGGALDKLIGGEASAVFGAPAAHEDDPDRAVRAALAIRDWTVAQPGLEVRIAVNTGEALITSSAEAIATGEVVSKTARLQLAAPPNSVLVGDRTHRATGDSVEYRAAQADGVWEAVRVRAHPVSTALSRTPFVGRRRELELLCSTLARVRREQSCQLVTLVGVPGIGKSRLVDELRQVAGSEVAWRQGRSLPYGEGVTFWALGEMVKQQAGILESDTSDEAAEKLRSAVSAVMESDAGWVEAQLRPLAGISTESGGEPTTAGRRFFEALTRRGPTVLAFDDLHWADDGLLDFIDELVGRASGPLLVIGTTRPELLERRPSWGSGRPNALALSLQPLAAEDTAQLVASLAAEPISPATLTELVGRAEGNPLYAEQYVRALLEQGSVTAAPETVQGIIAARLDGLPGGEKQLLQDAAVVGTVFWLGPLGLQPLVEDLVRPLERKQFVRRGSHSSVAGETEYAFSHGLLRDVAYGQIPRAARSDKHRRVASWIESLGRPEDHAEMLAHHYLSALEYGEADAALVERARVALRAAGDRALALASYGAAARFYNAALELWPDSDPDRLSLLVLAGRARFGSDQTGVDLLEAAVEKLETRGDHDGAAQVALDLAHILWLACDSDAASAYGERATELTRGHDTSPVRAYALLERAASPMHASEHAKAMAVVREALALTAALGMDDLHARALDLSGSCRVYGGDPGGVKDAERAVALARESNAFSRLIIAQLNLRCLHFFTGQLDAAREVLEAARGDVERYGRADQRKWLSVATAHEDMLDGRWDAAEQILNAFIADIDQRTTPYYLDPSALVLHAVIRLARGALDDASVHTERALERGRRIQDPQVLAQTLLARAMALLAEGERDQAAELAAEILGRGSLIVTALLEMHSAVTPIELGWLLRDLDLEAELLSVLSSTPSNPWLEAASAIAAGDFECAVKLARRIGAASIEAYTQLRAAEAMAAAGRHAEAAPLLERALGFYRSVGATRYVAQAETVAATGDQSSIRTPATQ